MRLRVWHLRVKCRSSCCWSAWIYIIETLSVILQVTYFKATHGKRLFKMAPIHHHFEMCGWGEKKIVLVFTGITVVLCLLAYHVALAPLF